MSTDVGPPDTFWALWVADGTLKIAADQAKLVRLAMIGGLDFVDFVDLAGSRVTLRVQTIQLLGEVTPEARQRGYAISLALKAEEDAADPTREREPWENGDDR